MVHRPRLLDGCDLPESVNGWTHDPESGKNAHVWTSDADDVSLGVFNSVGRVRVAVFDDRVSGFENHVDVYEQPLPDDCPHEDEPSYVAEALEEAVAWMHSTKPGEWEHPDVCKDVFDPPPGFVLDRYYLEQREHIVYYRRADAEKEVKMAAGGLAESEPSLDTRKYLYVKTWRGSGNATVALAPWLRAHEHELEEIVDPPEECGLEVALAMARRYVAEHTDGTDATDVSGQSDLAAFTDGGSQ